MVQSIVKSVVGVISAVGETQQAEINDFDYEYQSSSNWISNAIEVCSQQFEI